MKALAALFYILFGFSLIAQGQSTVNLSETFYSNIHFDSANSTLIWNPYFHMIHTPLAISYTSGANTEDSLNAPVGNAQNGIFDVSTYASFSVGGVTPGNVITIDTSVFPVIQVLYFNLVSGWSIRGVGPNPLWIESLGPVTIAGLIDCSGENGTNTDTITTSPTIGGTGHCGGGNGGSGGYNGTAATAGTSGGGTTTGGAPGGPGSNGGGGGGGGGFRGAVGLAAPGVTGGGAGGAAGAVDDDPKFTVLGGGAGGGGGGYNGVALARGASGGGGGGVIRITVIGTININSGGKLFTAGGTGGGGTALGGGGGGGAGGGIWLQTAGSINDNGGAIDAGAFAADGNNNGIVVGGNNGGRGSDGRTWLTLNAPTANPASETPSSELLTAVPFDEGETHFSVAGGYVAQSLSYDSGNTAPNYNLFSMLTSLPGTATATILVSASKDNFVTDNTGFIPITNLNALQGKRYFKFQVTLQQDSTVAPASTASAINSVTANYLDYKETNFQFTQSCGYIGGPKEGFFLLGLFVLIYFLTIGRLRRKILFPMSRPKHSRSLPTPL